MSSTTTVGSNIEKPASEDAIAILSPEGFDFDEDIGKEERDYYKTKFKDLNEIKHAKLHCSSCDKHLGNAARNESRMRSHPMLRTLVCQACHAFYNSGEFEKGDDGSELYCRWCGQGGQVYCCSDCPHVFCAKCIKRNLGTLKIKEIESADDWKCFKCDPKSLWDLRAICWALLCYVDLKNKLAYKTEDPELKEKYQKECTVDDSECCREKRKRSSVNSKKKEEKEDSKKQQQAAIISKITPTIQVKKFASINPEELVEKKIDKKRPASPIKIKSMNMPGSITSIPIQPPAPQPFKRIKLHNTTIAVPNTYKPDKKPQNTYNRMPVIRPRIPLPSPAHSFNGFNAMIPNDNINLSLESLTQGLDLAAVVAMASNNSMIEDSDVVCTPDLPMDQMLSEANEDNNDDDVQCITPGPIVAPKMAALPPLVPKPGHSLPDLSPENIIQMTDNDVTVNTVTGGLKFRVDPQTLSSNKVYRLPDGRIFAINANSNMPGGYSASIVAVTGAINSSGKASVARSGTTFAAKLSAVSTSTPSPLGRQGRKTPANKKRPPPKTPPKAKVKQVSNLQGGRKMDMKVPVEWYNYNLVDAVDALEYSLSRLQRIKKETTTAFLRSRTVGEIRVLHRSLERLLKTSSSRFQDICENLNQGFQEYLAKKGDESEDDEDDDVEILPNKVTEDPIYIDENSVDSTTVSANEEVDLVSDHNDSTEKEDNLSVDKDAGVIKLNDSGDSEKSQDISKLCNENPGENNDLNNIKLNLTNNANNKVIINKDESNGDDDEGRNSANDLKEGNNNEDTTDSIKDAEKEKDTNDSKQDNIDEDETNLNKDPEEKETNHSKEDNMSENDTNKNKDAEEKDANDPKDDIDEMKDTNDIKEDNIKDDKNCETEATEKMDTDERKDSEKGTGVNGESDHMDMDTGECEAVLTNEKNDDKDSEKMVPDILDDDSENKLQDTELSDEMIETLLKDEAPNEAENEIQRRQCLETLQENSSILSN